MPSALERGSSHGHISSDQREAAPDRSPSANCHARTSGAHPSVCTAWRRVSGDSVDQSGADAAGEGAASDLDEDAVQRHPGGGGLIDDLPTQRAPAVEAQRVLRALHAERDGAGVHRLPEPQHAGRASATSA